MSPSGVSTIAIGPIPPSLWPMPVAKARPVKGLSTDSNSLGADSGSAAGTFASACVNNSLVEGVGEGAGARSEEHTSELQSLMRISYAVFCLNKKTKDTHPQSR